MIRNYFKTLVRNMQKNKLHTAINLVGLTVAFTCSILLLVMTYHEFSFDQFHVHKNKLFKIYSYTNGPEGEELSASMPYPVASTLKSEGIGVEKATRIKERGREIRYKEKTLEQSANLVDNDFFSMFSFPLIKGAKQQPLSSTNDVVLSETTANNLFGTEDPIGKTVELKVAGQWISLQVSAIIADNPQNSSLHYAILARTEIDPDYAKSKDEWNMTHHSVYVQLAESAKVETVQEQLRLFSKKYYPADADELKKRGFKPDARGDYFGKRLLPITELHFNAEIGDGSVLSKRYLWILLLVALVIVLIACFNFINLNIGLSFTRTKEMGIRKCLGAGKRQIWLQVWGESFFIVLTSMLIGLMATLILLKGFNQLMVTQFDHALFLQPSVIGLLILLLIVVSFFASGYPSYIMGQLKTVEILKGKISLKRPGFFRNALVVAQFAIAIVLICTTLIIYQQFQHLRNAPLGYSSHSIVSIPLKQYEKGKEVVAKMRTLLSAQSSIVSVTGSDVNLGVGADHSFNRTGFGFGYNGKIVNTDFMAADYDFLKTLNIPIKAGRDFSTAYPADSNQSVIITESMAKQLTDQDAVGLSFYSDSSRPKWNVIAVIPDFHLYSMYEKSAPLTIGMNNSSFISYILVRVQTQNPSATMELIQQAYAQTEPGVEFKGSYVTENIDRWYTNEKRLSDLFSIAAIVAIMLSCMGLFGMAFIVIRQRVKEIGVRKVLGASIGSIATLVMQEFIKPVLIAIMVARFCLSYFNSMVGICCGRDGCRSHCDSYRERTCCKSSIVKSSQKFKNRVILLYDQKLFQNSLPIYPKKQVVFWY